MTVQNIQRIIERVGTWLASAAAAIYVVALVSFLLLRGLSGETEQFTAVIMVFVGVAVTVYIKVVAKIMARMAGHWLHPENLQAIGKPRAFNVYNHPKHGYKAVKIGFCWPACLIGPLWMLFCRLWEQGCIYIGVWLVFGIMGAFPPFLLFTFPAMAFLSVVVFGFRGNRWRHANLQARGYEFIAAIPAESKDEAIIQARKTQTG